MNNRLTNGKRSIEKMSWTNYFHCFGNCRHCVLLISMDLEQTPPSYVFTATQFDFGNFPRCLPGWHIFTYLSISSSVIQLFLPIVGDKCTNNLVISWEFQSKFDSNRLTSSIFSHHKFIIFVFIFFLTIWYFNFELWRCYLQQLLLLSRQVLSKQPSMKWTD